MAVKNLSYFDYVKAAFFWRHRVPLLGHIPLNIYSLAGLAVLSLLHPGFLLLGIAVESAYLIFVPGSDRFQKVIKGRQLLDVQDTWKQRRDNLIIKLDTLSQSRYQALNEQCLTLQKQELRDGMSEGLHEYGLNQLLWTFLQLLASRDKISWMLRNTSPEKIQNEISILEKNITNEKADTPLYASHMSTLEITRKRLDNLDRAKSDLAIIDAELQRIEQRFALFREESALSTSPSAVTARLDGVMQSLQETSSWLNDHRELLSDSVDTIPPEVFSMQNSTVKE